jgi:outer membrane protein assembly factor BamB
VRLWTQLAVAAAAALFLIPVAVHAQWTLPHFSADLNPVLSGSPTEFRWQFRMHDGTSTVPTVDGSTLFVASNDRSVYALNLYTGALKWRTPLANDVMTPPIVYKGVVIVGIGGSTSSVWHPPDRIVVGTGANAIVALRERDGSLLWTYVLRGTGMPGGMLVHDLYVHHDGAGDVVALDWRSGRLVWRKNVRSAAAMSAIAPGAGGLLISAGVAPASIFALREDGSRAWTHTLPRRASGVADTPIATDGNDYACTMYLQPLDDHPFVYVENPVSQHLIALHARSGKLRWDVVLERGVLRTKNWAAIPILAGGRIFIGSELRPYVHAVDARTGRLLWKRKLNGLDQSAGVVKGGVLYIGDSSGMLWALNAANGTVIGAKQFPDGFRVGSPIIVGKTLIVGTDRGYVLAVPLNDLLTAHEQA